MSFLRIMVKVCIAVSCLATGSVVSGCNDRSNIEDTLKTLSPLSINTYTLDSYVIPGSTAQIDSVCEPVLMGPDKPVFVWRISRDGNFIEEIIHDADTRKFSSSSDNSTVYRSDEEEETHEKYSWPNFDELKYTFNEPGTYTIETTLYEYDEYSRDGNKALIVSNDSLTIYCDTVRLSVEAAPTPNVRQFTFKARIENPQFLKNGYPVKWEFINASSGQPDAGTTDEVSLKDSLFTAGVQEIDHTFQKAGKYKVLFTISDYEWAGGKSIASAEVLVDVTTDFTIVPPPGPLTTGKDYKFIAHTNSPGDLTETPSYEWDFGDGTKLIVPYSNEVIHSFSKPGNYTVSVQLFEHEYEAANLLGVASIEVKVEPSTVDFLNSLHQTNWIEIGLVCPITTEYGTVPALISEWGGSISKWGVDNLLGEVQWEGSRFSVTWSGNRHSEIISGNVRQDGSDLYVSLEARHEEERSTNNLFWEINISELPLSTYRLVKYGENRFEARIRDSDVPHYVTYFGKSELVSVDWTSKLELNVVFDSKTN